jgi:hypothetical protein
MSLMTKSTANGQRIASEQRRAERARPYREAGNDRCRNGRIYAWFEKPPRLPSGPTASTVDSGTIERRLSTRLREQCEEFRRRRALADA